MSPTSYFEDDDELARQLAMQRMDPEYMAKTEPRSPGMDFSQTDTAPPTDTGAAPISQLLQKMQQLKQPQQQSEPDLSKIALQQLLQRSNNPSLSPEAQKATQLRQLFAGLASSPGYRQWDYVHGGLVKDPAQEKADEDRRKELQTWAQEPLKQNKEAADRQKELIDELSKIDNLRSQKTARDYTDFQRHAQTNKINTEEKFKNDSRDPNSQLSETARQGALKSISTTIGQLESDVSANPGKRPVYATTSNQLQALLPSIKNMNYDQIQDVLKQNKELFDQAHKMTGTDINEGINRANIFINQGRLGETTRHNQATEEQGQERLDNAGTKIAATVGTKEDQYNDKMRKGFAKDVNALSASSRNALGVAANTDAKIDRFLEAIDDPKVHKDPTALNALTADVASAVTGGVPTKYSQEHNAIKDFRIKVQEGMNWISGHPDDVRGIEDKIQNMRALGEDMRKVSHKYMDKNAQTVYAGIRPWAERTKQDLSDIIGAAGVNVPAANGGQSDPLLIKSKKALSDPKAPPEAKAAAQKYIDAHGGQ